MILKDLPQHHAVLLVIPNQSKLVDELWNELSALSPAHKLFSQTVLDIDTARSIISWTNIPYNDEKVGLVSFHTATIPAQNAMLKILEEPRVGVRFIVITSNKENLIDTVISRLYEFKIESKEQIINNKKQAIEFLQTKQNLRIKLPFIVEILSRTDEEGRKDRATIRDFILSLSEILSFNRAKARYIKETISCASYASDPSASTKAIMEYLSLLLPEVNT